MTKALDKILADDLDPQVALNGLAVILEAHAQCTGRAVSFTAQELATAIDITPGDVLDKTADLVHYWYLDGEKYATYRELVAAKRQSPLATFGEVEIEIFRQDAGLKLLEALTAL